MNRMVLGVFSSEEDAQTAIEDLEAAGYQAKDISIVMKHVSEDQVFADTSGTTVANSVVSGAVTGGVIGGLAGLLIGLGAIAVPGIGALLIGGPIAVALGATGAAATTVSGAATGILAGGLLGALVGVGVSQEDAAIYEEKIKNGGILVAVPAQVGKEEEVMAILEDNAADKIQAIDSSIELESEGRYEDESSRNKSYQHAFLGAKGGRSKAGGMKRKSKKKAHTKS